MKKNIEFQESNTDTSALISRWPEPKRQFDDLILTPEHRDAKARLPEGTCTIRVLPAIKGGPERWWIPIEAQTYTVGQHADPKTHEPGAQGIFDLAQAWFEQNAPKALYSKSAGKGFKLWTQPMAACWLLVTLDGQTNLKLLVASAFAGTTARRSGLAHQLITFVEDHPAVLNPGAKHSIEVTRRMPEGGKFLDTTFRVVESDHSLTECIVELPIEQNQLICPVGETIRRIDPEDEWKLLEKAIGRQWTDKIRNSSQPRIT